MYSNQITEVTHNLSQSLHSFFHSPSSSSFSSYAYCWNFDAYENWAVSQNHSHFINTIIDPYFRKWTTRDLLGRMHIAGRVFLNCRSKRCVSWTDVGAYITQPAPLQQCTCRPKYWLYITEWKKSSTELSFSYSCSASLFRDVSIISWVCSQVRLFIGLLRTAKHNHL